MVAIEQSGARAFSPVQDRARFAQRVGVCLIGILTLAAAINLRWGAATDTDVLRALFAGVGFTEPASLRDQIVIWDVRLPRLILGALVGAALAVSGAVMQGLFRNPLADPGLIGVSAGAGFGAVCAIVLGGLLPAVIAAKLGTALVPFAAFLGGWCATMILYGVSTRSGRTSVATMLLAGIALAALTGALTGLIVYYADDSQLRDLTFWSMGSLAGATWAKLGIAAPMIMIALCFAPALARALNALALGEAAAAHLGIPVQRMKSLAMLGVAASVGASVAVTGGIGFVGIVVPHLLRLVHGPDHRFLLPNAALLGAAMLLLADTFSRTIIAPAELPIGIVTAMIGGPFFLWILLRNRSVIGI